MSPPAAAGKPPPVPVDVYRTSSEPFLAIHNFASEEEAALAHDYATLWLQLCCKPGTVVWRCELCVQERSRPQRQEKRLAGRRKLQEER